MGMTGIEAAGDLHVLVALSSADLRIGAVNDALDLAELSAPHGARFTMCGALTPAFCAEAAKRGAATLEATTRPFSRREFPLYAWDVVRWLRRLRRLRPDVVHLNYPGFGPSLAAAARLTRIPLVARAGPVVRSNPCMRWVEAYVANCQPQAAELLASAAADRVVVAGDLFRPDRIASTMTLVRPLPARRDGLPRIVFLGQIVERKGIHVLIEAMAHLRGAAELLLVGGDWSSPGYPQRLKALARDAGIEAHVHFENHRNDIGALLDTADIFVLPSLSEARPRSVIEAMSAGVPVVASATGGLPSLITHERTGLLVPTGEVDHLAGALNRLIQSAAARKRLGDAGRESIAEQCRPDRTAREYVALYRRAIERQPAAAANVSLVANARS
jgi:glycosyltransferase involved in cell wall biosynthesis